MSMLLGLLGGGGGLVAGNIFSSKVVKPKPVLKPHPPPTPMEETATRSRPPVFNDSVLQKPKQYMPTSQQNFHYKPINTDTPRMPDHGDDSIEKINKFLRENTDYILMGAGVIMVISIVKKLG